MAAQFAANPSAGQWGTQAEDGLYFLHEGRQGGQVRAKESPGRLGLRLPALRERDKIKKATRFRVAFLVSETQIGGLK